MGIGDWGLSKNKSKGKKEEIIIERDVNNVIQKSKYQKAINTYLIYKKKIYEKELKEEKKPKKEITFGKLNITLNDFERSRNINSNYKIKKGIVSKMNNMQKLKFNSTIEKVWKKITPGKNYEKFIEEYDYSRDKSKIILRKINEEKEKINSMINIGINNLKNIFGEKMCDMTNKNFESKAKKDPIIFLIKRNIIKNNNNKSKNINTFKYKKSFSVTTSDDIRKNKAKIIRRSWICRNNMKEIINNDMSRNKSKTVKIKKMNLNEKNKKSFSKFNGLNDIEKTGIKKEYNEKSFQKIYSRNKNNLSSIINSDNQKNEIFKEYNKIIETTKKMRLKHLDNNIIPLNQVDSIMKTREELKLHSFRMKYLKDVNKLFFKKGFKRKKQYNFKERFLKNAELFGDERDYNI